MYSIINAIAKNLPVPVNEVCNLKLMLKFLGKNLVGATIDILETIETIYARAEKKHASKE